MKSPNEIGRSVEEATEGRSPTKGNTSEHTTPRTQSRTSAPDALDRVRGAARRDRKKRFTALLHHVTIDRLRMAYQAIERRAASGVDGMTWKQYGEDLEARLRDLHASSTDAEHARRTSGRTSRSRVEARASASSISAWRYDATSGAWHSRCGCITLRYATRMGGRYTLTAEAT